MYREFILPDLCKPCLFIFAKLIGPYPPTRGIQPSSVFGPFPMDSGRGFPFSFKPPAKIPMPQTGEGAPPARAWRSIRISDAEYLGTVGAMTLTSAGKGSVFFVVGCAYVWNCRILQL